MCAGRTAGQLCGKLESIIDSNVCSECGVERKGVWREGEGGGSLYSAIHISPYLPITSSESVFMTQKQQQTYLKSVQFPNANVSFQIPFKEGKL